MKPKSNLYIYVLATVLFAGAYLVTDLDRQSNLLVDRNHRLYASRDWSYNEKQRLKHAFEDAAKKLEDILGKPSLQGTAGLVFPVDSGQSSSQIVMRTHSIGSIRVSTVNRRIVLSRLALEKGRMRGIIFHELAHYHLQPYSDFTYQFEDGVSRFDIFGEAVAETVRILASERTSLEPYWEYDRFEITPECNKPGLSFRGLTDQYMPLYYMRERMAAATLIRWELHHPGFMKRLHREISRRKLIASRFREDILPIAEHISPGFSSYITSQHVFSPHPKKGYNLFVIGDDDEIFCSLSYTDDSYGEHPIPRAKISLRITQGKHSTVKRFTLDNNSTIHYRMSSKKKYVVTATCGTLAQSAGKITDTFTFNKDAILR